MNKRALAVLLVVASPLNTTLGAKQQEDPVRIGVDLVQVDVVVTDRNGRVVKGLTPADFTLLENGRKQEIGFFEYLEAGKRLPNPRGSAAPAPSQPAVVDLTESEVRRVFAFVIDDLTIRAEDLSHLRTFLSKFLNEQMQRSDLVAFFSTVGGRSHFGQFSSDKRLLEQALDSIGPVSHSLSAFNNSQLETPASLGGAVSISGQDNVGARDLEDDANKGRRALASLGTASFVVDGLAQLPGRKSVVLISGGLPVFGAQGTETATRDNEMLRLAGLPTTPLVTGTVVTGIPKFLAELSGKAARAGVVIHTVDIRGMQADLGVASFQDTPGRSALNVQTGQRQTGTGFGRTVDESLLGLRNPLDSTDARRGLKALASETGGLAVVGRNDVGAGLESILAASEGYYLLAYTPSDGKFDGSFRKIDIRVRGDGLKVLSRRGYFAAVETKSKTPATKQEQMLVAMRSPLARRDLEVQGTISYKAAGLKQGLIEISLAVGPSKVQFEQAGGQRHAELDVAVLVFDELGNLRGGKSDTITQRLTEDDYLKLLNRSISYSADTTLPSGTFQLRMAVRDSRTGLIGTLSRYVEVPDLSKGRLNASSLMLAAVPRNDVTAAKPTPLGAASRISRQDDLRYALMIYNAKTRDQKARTIIQVIVSQNGRPIHQEPDETLSGSPKSSFQLIKVGQFGLGRVRPGRYTLTVVVTDTLAEKRAQTLTRSSDFVVVD